MLSTGKNRPKINRLPCCPGCPAICQGRTRTRGVPVLEILATDHWVTGLPRAAAAGRAQRKSTSGRHRDSGGEGTRATAFAPRSLARSGRSRGRLPLSPPRMFMSGQPGVCLATAPGRDQGQLRLEAAVHTACTQPSPRVTPSPSHARWGGNRGRATKGLALGLTAGGRGAGSQAVREDPCGGRHGVQSAAPGRVVGFGGFVHAGRCSEGGWGWGGVQLREEAQCPLSTPQGEERGRIWGHLGMGVCGCVVCPPGHQAGCHANAQRSDRELCSAGGHVTPDQEV